MQLSGGARRTTRERWHREDTTGLGRGLRQSGPVPARANFLCERNLEKVQVTLLEVRPDEIACGGDNGEENNDRVKTPGRGALQRERRKEEGQNEEWAIRSERCTSSFVSML